MKSLLEPAGIITVSGVPCGFISIGLIEGDDYDEPYEPGARGGDPIPASFTTEDGGRGDGGYRRGDGQHPRKLPPHHDGGHDKGVSHHDEGHTPGESAPRHGGQTLGDLPTSGTLQEQRARLADELRNNPDLRHRFRQIIYNEQGMNQEGGLGVAESAMNRALVRGTPLSKELRWHRREKGYYQEGGGVGWRGSQAQHEKLDATINRALRGSDISAGATDNSSGNLARREMASGAFVKRYGATGETFFRPGTAEPALAKRWQVWRQGVETSDAANKKQAITVKPIAGITDTNPM